MRILVVEDNRRFRKPFKAKDLSLLLEDFSRKKSEQEDPKPSSPWMGQSVDKLAVLKPSPGPLN